MGAVTVSTFVPQQTITAPFGGLTRSGAGGKQLKDSNGNNLSGVTIISNNIDAAVTTGGVLTPNSHSAFLGKNGQYVWVDCNLGKVAIQLVVDDNAYSAASVTEMETALHIGTLVRGTHSVLLRDDSIINEAGGRYGADWRSVGPSGSSGYIAVTGHTGEGRPQVRSLTLEGNAGGPSVHYPIHYKDIDFVGTVSGSYSGFDYSIGGANDCHGVKVTGCTFTSDITDRNQRNNLFNGISGFNIPIIHDNTFEYVKYGVKACNGIDFQRNIVSSFSQDAIQIGMGGSIIADNFMYGHDPSFNEYTVTDYTNITTGSTTVFAVAGHTETAGDTAVRIRSADGAMAAFVGNVGTMVSAVAGVSFTLNIDTTGLDMSSVTEVVIECSTSHVDYVQTTANQLAVSGDPSFGSGYDYQIRRNIIVNNNTTIYADASQGLFLKEETESGIYPVGLISHNIIVGPNYHGIMLDNDGANIVLGNVVLSGGSAPADSTWINIGRGGAESGYSTPEASILAYNIANNITQTNVSITEFQNVEPTSAQLSTYFSNPTVWPNIGPTKADVISQYTSIGAAAAALQGGPGSGRVDYDAYTDEIPPLVWASSGVNNAGNLDLSVSTTPDSTGTIYSVITTNASATFTGAEIEAGTDPDVAYATSAADSAGRQTIVYTTPASGTYYAHSVLKRSGSYSPIDVSAGITIP